MRTNMEEVLDFGRDWHSVHLSSFAGGSEHGRSSSVWCHRRRVVAARVRRQVRLFRASALRRLLSARRTGRFVSSLVPRCVRTRRSALNLLEKGVWNRVSVQIEVLRCGRGSVRTCVVLYWWPSSAVVAVVVTVAAVVTVLGFIRVEVRGRRRAGGVELSASRLLRLSHCVLVVPTLALALAAVVVPDSQDVWFLCSRSQSSAIRVQLMLVW